MNSSKKHRTHLVKQSLSLLLFFFLCHLFLAVAANADPYQQGNFRTWLSAGRGEAFNDEYFLLGMGFGYFPIDNLEVGIDAEYWLSGKPGIQKIGLQTQYILPLSSPVKPYGGVLYRYTIVSGTIDMNSYGFRGGLYFNPAETVILGLGVVHEIYVSGDQIEFEDYGRTYPEFTVSFSF